MEYIEFIAGFLLTIKGADMLVSGSANIARRASVSGLVIGMTIVAFGTSLPEMVVSIFASIEGDPDIAIGNILGSNIANILLILGTVSLFYPLPIRRSTMYSEIPFSLAAVLLVGFLVNTDLWYENSPGLIISRGDGLILIFFFLLFLVYMMMIARSDRSQIEIDTPTHASPWKSVFYILAGIVGLFFGGKWIVDGSVKIAQAIGMSEAFIGLTLVALGTSLPELVTSIMAALRKETDIAVGNVVGSNIFNLLWVFGLSSLVKPIPFLVASNTDILVVIGATVLIILALIAGGSLVIKRRIGIVFLLAYAAYCYFLFVRG